MNATTEIDQDKPVKVSLDEVLSLLISILSDGIDHPEVWDEIPGFLEIWPDMPALIAHRLEMESNMTAQALLVLLKAVAEAEQGHIDTAFAAVEELAIRNSQSALVQGALFRLKAIREPDNPAYDLSGTFCSVPFRQLDVLENSSHQCCASWLNASAGNLQTQPWGEVWNSPTAKAIRASIHDGKYRYCNKSACPAIAGKTLQTVSGPSPSSVSSASMICAHLGDSSRASAFV
ncbi:MAG: SPASM domain-containing protein [Pseudomonadota bacterium]